jgi:hypothetical protein
MSARLHLPNLPDIGNIAGARRMQLRLYSAGKLPNINSHAGVKNRASSPFQAVKPVKPIKPITL